MEQAAKKYKGLSRELMALRVANELEDGTYVNLGIGIPTLVSDWIEGRDITLQAELGMLNTGPLASQDEVEQDLINALDQAFLDISERESGRPVIARITLSGSGPLFKFLRGPNAASDLLEILHELGTSYSPSVWVEQIQVRVGPEIDPMVRMKERDFLGDLLRYSRELLGDRHLGELVREDLAPLFESSRIRRYLDSPEDHELKALLEEATRICLEGLHGEEAE